MLVIIRALANEFRVNYEFPGKRTNGLLSANVEAQGISLENVMTSVSARLGLVSVCLLLAWCMDKPLLSDTVLLSQAGSPPQRTQTKAAASNPKPGGVLDVSESNIGLGLSDEVVDEWQRFDGYGDALHRMTAELIRLLRKDHVNVVWLFEESASMRDDAHEIRERISKIYEEVALLNRTSAIKEKRELLSLVDSYGNGFHSHLTAPTADVAKIKAAIDKIPIDESGTERLFAAVRASLTKYQKLIAKLGKTIIVVATDEVGDDHEQHLEGSISLARKLGVPVYIFGREAPFGSPYSYYRWRDPKSKRVFRIPAVRGPESASPECLQWDGFRRLYDTVPSGFGPYPQIRMVRETGGLFFLLPSAEFGEKRRPYDALAMKEYAPLLRPRAEYIKSIVQTPFRQTIVSVIKELNPLDKSRKLVEIRPDEAFAIGTPKSMQAVKVRITQTKVNLQLVEKAQDQVLKLRPLRAQESLQRWRANYDLMNAQLACYRVRLLQHLIGLDRFSRTASDQAGEGHDQWLIRHGAKGLLVPTDAEWTRLEIDKADIEELRKRAIELLEIVRMEHPGTPWARQAELEAARRFGVQLQTRKAPPFKKPVTPVKVPIL